MSGCLNPLVLEDVEVDVNHAPVLVNVTPQPSFRPIVVNVGANCRPVTFRADRIEDADRDTLSYRYSIFFDRQGDGETRLTLGSSEGELVPLEQPVDGSFYDFPSYDLTNEILVDTLGTRELNRQTGRDPADDFISPGQLLELRISDNGFRPGTDEPREGGALLFFSWLIDLTEPPGGSCPSSP